MQTLEIIHPDDWHCHLRDDPYLSFTVRMAANHYKRVVAMPNLKPPVSTVALGKDYFKRIMEHVEAGQDFKPLITLYLTQQTTPKIVQEAKSSGMIFAFKLYPMGVTTNSQTGVDNIAALYPVFAAMAECSMPLLIHGEVHEQNVDIFDREAQFLEVLGVIVERFPTLKIVLEHITTKEAVEFVLKASRNVAATITPQHLLYNRNDMLSGGIKPHLYCLPILKRKDHQAALIKASISGNPKFFIGTDSAPHAQSQKESACGCAGVFNHHSAIATYAEIFENANALSKLENFLSVFGPQFYGLPLNTTKIRLIKENNIVPGHFDYSDEKIIPFRAGEALRWKIENA